MWCTMSSPTRGDAVQTVLSIAGHSARPERPGQ
jgi:hypothetical protein